MKFRIKFSGRIILYCVILFFILPFAYWTSQRTSKNLKLRGVETTGKVIEIKGDKVVFEYIISDSTLVKIKELPSSNYEINKGDILPLIYDSMNLENVRVVWKE